MKFQVECVDDLVAKMLHYDQLVVSATKERDTFLKEATKQVVAQHELFFGIGDIVTKKGNGLWFKVVDFSLAIEDLEIRLWVKLQRVGKKSREFIKMGNQTVSAERHYAKVINKHWELVDEHSIDD